MYIIKETVSISGNAKQTLTDIEYHDLAELLKQYYRKLTPEQTKENEKLQHEIQIESGLEFLDFENDF